MSRDFQHLSPCPEGAVGIGMRVGGFGQPRLHARQARQSGAGAVFRSTPTAFTACSATAPRRPARADGVRLDPDRFGFRCGAGSGCFRRCRPFARIADRPRDRCAAPVHPAQTGKTVGRGGSCWSSSPPVAFLRRRATTGTLARRPAARPPLRPDRCARRSRRRLTGLWAMPRSGQQAAPPGPQDRPDPPGLRHSGAAAARYSSGAGSAANCQRQG